MDFLHVVLSSIDNCSGNAVELVEEGNISDNVEQFLLGPVALLISHYYFKH